jgi:hypothetical protein
MFVAWNRHNNAVERNRGTVPCGIFIAPVPCEEKLGEVLAGYA